MSLVARSGDRLGRDTALITLLTAFSRATGFARVVVSAAVLGTGLLGDVYQSANTVPNIVFELLAGGALQAALVPLFVGVRRDRDDGGFARTVGLVGATVTAALAMVMVVVMVASPLIARALSSAEPVDSVADDKVALATWFLVLFAPQIVFYGLGLVSTAALQARHRFAAAAVAPAVNNLVVIVTYGIFWSMQGDDPMSLDLGAAEIAVLAGGTTLAVVAFTSVPLIALVRATGAPLSPRVSFRDPVVVSVARTGGWATVQVAGTLTLTAAALVVGNGAEGGVAVFALALAVFLLPYALLSAPVATAALPRLAHLHQTGDSRGFRELVRRSAVRVVVPATVASVGMAALAWPLARAVVFGAADERGPSAVAHALVAFAVGVVPYGLYQLLTRVLMSRGEVWSAAVVSMLTAVVGVALMPVLAATFDDAERAAALATAHSIAHAAGVVLLVPMVISRVRRDVSGPVVGPVVGPASGGAPDVDGPTVIELVGPSTGGIRQHVLAVAHDLVATTWRVVVAAPVGVIEGAAEVPVPSGTSWRAVRAARRRLADLVADVGPDVVHAHGLKAGWVAIGVRGPRTVLTVHNVVLATGLRGRVLRLLESHVVRSVDAVVVTSAEMERRFAGRARELVLIPPVHEVPEVLRRREAVRRELGVSGPLVVTVARLHPQKDLDTFLAAMRIVCGRRPDVTALIVGDGPERPKLAAIAADIAPTGSVRLVGARTDAVDLMAAADTVVISSSWESGPLTLLEAGAVGAPLVSTGVGFVPEIVTDGEHGLVVRIGAPDELAAAVMALLDDTDRARAMGRALAAAVRPRLDRADATAALLALYAPGRPIGRTGPPTSGPVDHAGAVR